MRLHLFAFGKLRNPGMRDAADYYLRLLGGYVDVSEHELKPLAVTEKSAAARKQVQEKESAILLEKTSKALGPRGALFLLDEGGRQHPTSGWAGLVRAWESQGAPDLGLVIGSSLGFSDAVRKASKGILSLGPQTLPHELARVVLLEQLYRAWSVTRNHPYHNEGS